MLCPVHWHATSCVMSRFSFPTQVTLLFFRETWNCHIPGFMWISRWFSVIPQRDDPVCSSRTVPNSNQKQHALKGEHLLSVFDNDFHGSSCSTLVLLRCSDWCKALFCHPVIRDNACWAVCSLWSYFPPPLQLLYEVWSFGMLVKPKQGRLLALRMHCHFSGGIGPRQQQRQSWQQNSTQPENSCYIWLLGHFLGRARL